MDFGKILLLYLSIAIAVSFFFPQVVLNKPDQSILGLFHITYNTTTSEVQITEKGFTDTTLEAQTTNKETEAGFWQSLGQSISTYFQSFTDGLKNVIGVLSILLRFLFSPFLFVADPNLLGNAPSYVKVIFALPLVLLALISTIKVIRGVS